MKTLYQTSLLLTIISCALVYSFKPSGNEIQKLILSEVTGRTVIQDMIATKKASENFSEYSVLKFKDKKNVNDLASDVSTFSLDKKEMTRLNTERPSYLSFKFEGGKEIILDLSRCAVYSPDFKCVVREKNGDIELQNPELGLHYRGVIRGSSRSIAAISVYPDFIMAIVSDETGNYNLGPVNKGKFPVSDEYVYYNDRNMVHKTGFDCETGESAADVTGHNTPKDIAPPPPPPPAPCTPVNIYLEADYSMYVQSGGNAALLLQFMGGVFNGVSAIYANESCPIIWGNYFIWGVPDPYTASNDPQTILGLFTANHNGSFPTGTQLAQLQSFRMGSPGAGYSNLGVICHPTLKTSFASIETTYNIYPTYSNAVDLSAHEFGHSFGSRHTHACVWNGNNTGIDQCVVTAENAGCSLPPAAPILTGTIMSYCVPIYGGATDFTLGFGPQPGAVIRANYNGSCACILPVELSSFQSFVHDNNVLLKWETVFETNNSHFEIERKNLTGNTWEVAGRVSGSGTTTGTVRYSFVDKALRAGTYSYRLSQYDYNGNASYHELTQSVVISNPDNFALDQNYPNPFNPSTNISFKLPESSVVSLVVYEMSGKLVSTLINNLPTEAGAYVVRFNGNGMASGIYFYKLVVNGAAVDTKKMILVK